MLAAVTALFVVVAPGVAIAQAPAPIYKCRQPGGAILYADYPCKNGAVVDLRPGTAAPDARERLARAQDELDRAAARRQALEAAEFAQRSELAQRRLAWEAAAAADAPIVTYQPAYGYYGGYVTPRRHPVHTPPLADNRRAIPQGRVPAVIRRP